MPALDLALGLRMVWRATDVVHALVFEPIGEITGNLGRTIVAEQPGFVDDFAAVASSSAR